MNLTQMGLVAVVNILTKFIMLVHICLAGLNHSCQNQLSLLKRRPGMLTLTQRPDTNAHLWKSRFFNLFSCKKIRVNSRLDFRSGLF